ncbi:MAG: GNAT family N-acetyltransferase [Oscillospiraceae bacterium]|nr:GNAT family N-acetyltransferase [Oscillospiraceae bacterium]
MDKQGYILLFERIYPDFFESDTIRSLPEGLFFDEMLLSLSEFDIHKYDKTVEGNISFGFYEGGLDEIKKAAEKVDRDWVQFFDGTNRIYCGYTDGKIASFCLVDDMGTHDINGHRLKIGGPGCVGTLPEYRHRGIGLTMVRNVTQILKEEGYDYSYIHFTGVAPWYEKLGYKTAVKWNRNGVKLT